MPSSLESEIRRAIRDVPDFPRPGIVYKDITPLLLDAALFRGTTAALAEPFRHDRITHVVGIESRGFILGAPVAQALAAGFVPARKRGRLPYRVERVEYALEYGRDALEVHLDACGPSHRVLIVDDVLATGGTARAAGEAVERLGARVVGFSFLMTLSFLSGAQSLGGQRVASLVTY